MQLQRNVKLLDLTQERPAAILYLKKQAAEIVLDFKKLKEVSKLYNGMCIFTFYVLQIKLLNNAQLVKETHSVSSYTYPKKFPLAMILSAVHVVSSIIQVMLAIYTCTIIFVAS